MVLAATGLVVLMVLAAITPARAKEPSAIAFNAVPLVLAAVVAGVAGLASAHTPSHQLREHPTAAR
jgi:hypothetical protein